MDDPNEHATWPKRVCHSLEESINFAEKENKRDNSNGR